MRFMWAVKHQTAMFNRTYKGHAEEGGYAKTENGNRHEDREYSGVGRGGQYGRTNMAPGGRSGTKA
eukprot:gene40478-53524_t